MRRQGRKNRTGFLKSGSVMFNPWPSYCRSIFDLGPFPDSLSKAKLTEYIRYMFKIVCLYCRAKKHGIKSLESRSMSVKYPNLATCFDFNCLKPIVRIVSSSASPNSIPAVSAGAASTSCRPHPKKIINSSVTLHARD